jgi:hypothetical protein
MVVRGNRHLETMVVGTRINMGDSNRRKKGLLR